MGPGIVILIFLAGPTLYAKATRFQSPAYIPKSPRRPILMAWPSVMNPRVAEAIAEKLREREKSDEYLKIECNDNLQYEVEPFTLTEVKSALDKFPEHDRAPTFWDRFVPALIVWLSAEALECGFYTVFRDEQHQIYRFINANRRNWVKALQEIVYILVQVIAVIHHKTGTFKYVRLHQRVERRLNWLEEWVESYELWHKNYRTPRAYFKTFITNSLDIVIAWLFDYLARHTKHSKWRLSDDPDIVCALENYGMDKPFPYDYMMERVEDKMRVMADAFVTCREYRNGFDNECEYKNEFKVYIGINNSAVQDTIVRTPRPHICRFTCSNTTSAYKYLAYAHAHMTTELGHDFYCKTSQVHFFGNKVTMACHPLVVEKYIMAREYQVCCKEPKYPLHPHCEIVTNKLSYTHPNFKVTSTRWLTKTMKIFNDF